MKLAGLHIDRFGARVGLSLSDLSDQLNVVYGPNGAGKTTVIQFIRWVIFGQRDEISRRYLTTSGTPSSGSMTVKDGAGLRTLQRTCQPGSLLSQLTDNSQHQCATAPVGISNIEFDRFFTISFDQPRNVSDLFNSARSHGFQLHVDQRQLDRIQQLTEQIEQQRSELNRLGRVGAIDDLRTAQESKRQEIESIRAEWQRRGAELERQRNQNIADVSEQQITVERIRSVLANIESAIDTRRRQLADEHQQWLLARQESEERRQTRLRELDAQISRWQTILAEVRDRLGQLRNRISSFGDISFSATEATDLHFFMRKLGFRIRDIEQDLTGVYDSDSWRDHEADADYLRGLLGSALSSMQNDVNRLCQTVERQQQANELLECREELTYLCRADQELSDLIDALNRQRHQLGRESEFLPHIYGVETVSTCDTESWRDDLSAVSPSDLAALNDFRLRHLIERREPATARLSSADFEWTNRKRQLREIEDELSRHGNSGRIGELEREVKEIDEQMRQLERRIHMERTIASLEEELGRTRAFTGRSEIVDQASTILQTLTNNDYRGIQVTGDHQCVVSRSRTWSEGEQFAYSQLSRGVQDQVYLALSLAIVSAYRRKGVTVPLILNDVFANLDQSGIQALADVLSEFGERDQQLLVFTRHDHIRELFTARLARLYTLSDLDSQNTEPLPTLSLPSVYQTPHAQSTRVISRPTADLQPAPRDPSYEWVAEWQRRDPVHGSPKPTIPRPPVDEPEDLLSAAPVAPLTLDSGLTDASNLSPDFVRCLSELEIKLVSEFVDVEPSSLEQQLAEHGITAEMIQRRQRELLMIVYLGVSVLDAQLLVACGVPDPARLSRADEAVLLKRIETVLERPQASARFGSFSQYSLARIGEWIESARRSSYRGRPRRSSSLKPGRSPRSSSEGSGGKRGTSGRPTSSKSTTSGRGTKEDASRSTVKMPTTSLRFYLEVNDPIVDAPGIGPKTAEKLNQVDIYTVANLLDADPDDVAVRLDDRRINAEAVAQWQLQAQLVCRIPNLRGHDAQILVACGVEDPVTLASMDAGTFLKQVTKFVATKDGQRIIRNGKKPDLAEVTAWIEWSESARQLRAA